MQTNSAEQDHELAAALGERPHIGAETQRGEEGEQQRRLWRLVQRQLHVGHQADRGNRQRKQHTAHDRHRDAVALQERGAPDDQLTQEKQRRGEGQRLEQVQVEGGHRQPPAAAQKRLIGALTASGPLAPRRA